jgi:hypothetical protein
VESLVEGKSGGCIHESFENLLFAGTPTKAGVQNTLKILDSCFRRNDDMEIKMEFIKALTTAWKIFEALLQ